MNINFFSEESNYVFNEKKKFKNVVKIIEEQENRTFEVINIIFCSDEYLRKINIQYLNRDYYTDIITFPVQEKNISGDIFVSIDRIKENAIKFAVDFNDELKRVLIHGILHLCDYKDYNSEQKAVMTKKENFYLNFF